MNSNITYREQRNSPPFDWHRFLDQSWYSDNELTFAANKSHSWITCAVGNQCAAIPRNTIGAPDDIMLYELGVDFMNTIELMRYSERHGRPEAMYDARNKAKAILGWIEDRTALLLDEIQSPTTYSNHDTGRN